MNGGFALFTSDVSAKLEAAGAPRSSGLAAFAGAAVASFATHDRSSFPFDLSSDSFLALTSWSSRSSSSTFTPGSTHVACLSSGFVVGVVH